MVGPETWVPAFDRAGFRWLDNMQAEDILTRQRHGLHCRLCDSYISDPIQEHTKKHRAEYRGWKLRQEAKRKDAALNTLKRVNAERRLMRDLGIAS